jgi:hypothetical protein
LEDQKNHRIHYGEIVGREVSKKAVERFCRWKGKELLGKKRTRFPEETGKKRWGSQDRAV